MFHTSTGYFGGIWPVTARAVDCGAIRRCGNRGIDGKATDLIHAGLQRHHLLWLREMTPAEIREVGETGPTIDKIDVGECDSYAAVKEWLKAKAPTFAGGPA